MCPACKIVDAVMLVSVRTFGRAQEAGAIAVVIANHSNVLFSVLGKMPEMKLPGTIPQNSGPIAQKRRCDKRLHHSTRLQPEH